MFCNLVIKYVASLINIEHNKAETKRLTFCKQYFQCIFMKDTYFILIQISLKVDLDNKPQWFTE